MSRPPSAKMYDVEADKIGIVPDLAKMFIRVSAAESCVATAVSYQTVSDTPMTNWIVNSRKYAVSHPSDMLHIDVRFSCSPPAVQLFRRM